MRWLNAPVLFLDFDGVLHPDAVYRTKYGLYLKAKGELFQWAPLLEAALAEAPAIRVVLSTTWVRVLGYRQACSFLPAAVVERIVGGTWHRRFAREDGWDREWLMMSRFDQVQHYTQRRSVAHWVALDNDAEGWPDEQRHRLVHTDDMAGLGEPGKLAELITQLRQVEANWQQRLL